MCCCRLCLFPLDCIVTIFQMNTSVEWFRQCIVITEISACMLSDDVCMHVHRNREFVSTHCLYCLRIQVITQNHNVDAVLKLLSETMEGKHMFSVKMASPALHVIVQSLWSLNQDYRNQGRNIRPPELKRRITKIWINTFLSIKQLIWLS